jgi:hypothetical protein
MPYRSLSIFEIHKIPLPSRGFGVQRGLVSRQIEASSETPVLEVLAQDPSGIHLHVGVALLKIVVFGEVVDLAFFAIGLNGRKVGKRADQIIFFRL